MSDRLRAAAEALLSGVALQSSAWPPAIPWSDLADLAGALYGDDDERARRLRHVAASSTARRFAAVLPEPDLAALLAAAAEANGPRRR